jgi:hypothetical protein
MSTQKSVRRKRLALLPALVLGAGAAVSAPLATTAPATAAAQSVAPAPTKGATVDWFDDKYTALGAGSVFETATMERFEYLLKKPGKYAFIIGGPDSTTLQSSVGYINDVAKANGIQKIYNFNPKLDGGTLNVFDPSGLSLSTAGKDYIGAYGTKLVNDYLSKDGQTPFSNAHTSDPYLFVYDGSGGDTARITGALTAPVTAADVDTPSEVTAYKEDVAEVLTSGGPLAVDTQFDFLAGEHNRRLATRSNSADPTAYDQTKFGAPMFSAGDATDGFRVQSVTYPELIHILQSPGDFALLFGGTWCHNTAAIIHEANKDAQDFGIKKVYAFDFVLNTNDQTASNGGSNLLHIRDNAVVSGENRRASYLYGDLVNTYLTNAYTQYRKNNDPGTGSINFVSYYPGGDTTKPLAEARKIQVGHLLTYNKDHQDAEGNAAPVTNQAIRKNADGGFTEYMTEWWYVQGKDLPRTDVTLAGNSSTSSENNLNALENNRAFAKEGIAKIRNVLAAFAGGYASDVTVTDVPVSVGVGDTVPATATVTSADYNGFFSNNGAGGNNAPSTGVAKPTGTVTVREGSTELLPATALVDGAKALTIPAGLAAGQHTLTFEYSGSADGVIKPTTKTAQVNVVGQTATVAIDAPASLDFGTGGTVTANVTNGAIGSVKLTGLGADKTAAISNGKAVFAIPSDAAVATYSLHASYAGDDQFGAASATKELAVKKVATATSASAPATAYGKAGTVTVNVVTTNGAPLTGSVTLTGAGAPITQPVTGSKATFTLPVNLAVKTYGLTATYDGNSNVAGSTATTSLKISKVGVAGVAYKLNTKPTSKKKGKATVTVGTKSGLAQPTGKVTLTLKKGKTVKVVSGNLSAGKKALKLPKLPKGTWKLTVSYAGNANYLGWKSKAYAFHITK